MHHRNRIVMLCASINDVTNWPFWKFMQLRTIKGVTDLAMLAFTSDSGTFEGHIDGTEYTLRNFAKVKSFRADLARDFLRKWHVPGSTYFVYGGHGMGDYLELEDSRCALHVHELAALMEDRTYEGVVFDACLMANLDAIHHLRRHTRFVGACEGYMWEEDVDLEKHVFNTYTASLMSRCKDPRRILQLIEQDFTRKGARGDFAVLDTAFARPLKRFVDTYVLPRLYRDVTFITQKEHHRLSLAADKAMETAKALDAFPYHVVFTREADVATDSGSEGAGEGSSRGGGAADGASRRASTTAPAGVEAAAAGGASAVFRRRRFGAKERIRRSIQFPHSLAPTQVEDKHLCDLGALLESTCKELAAIEAAEAAGRSGNAAASRAAHALPLAVENFRPPRAGASGGARRVQQARPISKAEADRYIFDGVWGHSVAAPGGQAGGADAPLVGATAAAVPSYGDDRATAAATAVSAASAGTSGPVLTATSGAAASTCAASSSPSLPITSTASTPQGASLCTDVLPCVSPFLTGEDTAELRRIAALPASEQGLALFRRVVVSHQPPAASLYATKLNGLSMCAHEYSGMSEPNDPEAGPGKGRTNYGPWIRHTHRKAIARIDAEQAAIHRSRQRGGR